MPSLTYSQKKTSPFSELQHPLVPIMKVAFVMWISLTTLDLPGGKNHISFILRTPDTH